MIRLLISLVTVGAVIGCQMEDTETSGTLNVDPNSDTVVPEGVTVGDADLNSDGIIDITDLVIVSKFFGQEVPEAVVQNDNIPEYCQLQNIVHYRDKRWTEEYESGNAGYPLDAYVEDNSQFQETFQGKDGDEYIYALLGMRLNNVIWLSTLAPRYICIAVKISIMNNVPHKVTIKGVTTDHQLSIKDPKTYSLIDNKIKYPIWETNSIDRRLRRANEEINLKELIPSAKVTVVCDKITGGACSGEIAMSIVTDFNPNSSVNNLLVKGANNHLDHIHYRSSQIKDFWATPLTLGEHIRRYFKEGIPIGKEKIIYRLKLKGKYVWNIDLNRPDWSPVKGASGELYGGDLERGYHGMDKGMYINMSPAEVRRRYFPDDAQ